jgi:cytochrome c-type biogenesis protein CcmH
MNRLTLLLAALLLGAAPPGAAAQPGSEAELDAVTREVASGLRCPVCQGVSIQDSPTELAREMKGVIRRQLAEGRSPAEVRGYFVERYGEWVLLQPEARGFNLVVYLLPVLGLLAGGVALGGVMRRWTRVPPTPAALALPAGAGVEEEEAA